MRSALPLLTLLLRLAAAVLPAAALPSTAAGTGPNVVVILADDLGYTDWGMNGDPLGSGYYETPRLDALAREGVRFPNAYAASAVCSPSRHALLTGRSPARSRLTQWIPGSVHLGLLAEPPWRDGILEDEETLGDALAAAGYRTAFVGKWHLGPPASRAMRPALHGFQHSVGGGAQGTPPRWFADESGSFGLPGLGPGSSAAGQYLTERLTDEAVAFVEAAVAEEAPFLLFLSHYAVHRPYAAPEASIARYRAKPPSPRHGDPVYAAMVEHLDISVGRVLDALEAADVRHDTIVVFTSDNGGFLEVTSNAPLRAGKGRFYEGGVRVPLLVSWTGSPWIETDRTSDALVVGHDVFATLLDLLERPIPALASGQSFRAALEGGPGAREAVHFHYPHVSPESIQRFGGRHLSALRAGHWKLLYHYETAEWELFDLGTDPGEAANLAHLRRDVAHDLGNDLRDWLGATRARLPLQPTTFEPVPLPVPLPEPAAGPACVLALALLGARRGRRQRRAPQASRSASSAR